MFELEEAIGRWREAMAAGGVRSEEALDELESHLREETDRLIEAGRSPEEAFALASERLGEPAAMGREFGKLRRTKPALLALAGGGAAEEGENAAPRFPLFFYSVAGLAGTLSLASGLLAYFIIIPDSQRSGEYPYPSHLSSGQWAMAWGALALILSLTAIIFTMLGLRRWGRPGRVWPLVLGPQALLLPLYAWMLLAGLFNAPEFLSPFKFGARLVKTVTSPDGRFEAYALSYPAFDEPGQRIYVRWPGQEGGEREIRRLGLERTGQIHWSPDSALVAFETGGHLTVVDTRDMRILTIPLGAREYWRRGTFSVGSRGAKFITKIEFPRPGAVTYHYTRNQQPGSATLDLNVM